MSNKKNSDLAMIMPDEIKQISDIPVIFVRKTGNYDVSSEAAWDVMAMFMKKHHAENAKLRAFTIAHDDPEEVDEKNLRYDACVQDVPKIPVGGEVGRKVIPGGKYAIFTHKGHPDALGETYDRIFLKWLPASGGQVFDASRINFLEHDENWKDHIKIYIPLV